jgi:hypothetical protein
MRYARGDVNERSCPPSGRSRAFESLRERSVREPGRRMFGVTVNVAVSAAVAASAAPLTRHQAERQFRKLFN